MSFYVDVHCHLTHKDFNSDYQQVVKRAKESNLSAIVVNGLEPDSNRQILKLAEENELIKPALGIYPIDAVNEILSADFPLPIKKFNVSEEIAFIKEQVKQKKAIAIGECGLDGHWLGPETFARQEEVFSKLLLIAKDSNVPVIIHSRKLEKRCLEMVESHKNEKVVFHCFSGKSKLAIKAAENHGWCFSIPTIAAKSQGIV